MCGCARVVQNSSAFFLKFQLYKETGKDGCFCSSPLCFLIIEFHCSFSISYKILPYYVYYGLRGVSWWLCVCFIWLDMTTPPWRREKVMVYYIIIMFIIIVFRLGSDTFVYFYCLSKGSVTGCDSSRREGGWFFIFDCSSSFFFWKLNFIIIFPSLIWCYHVMFIIIAFDKVLTCSSTVSSQDFYGSLPRGQSRNVTPRLGVFVILQYSSFRIHASSFRLLVLRLCNNRCAEALVVKVWHKNDMKVSLDSCSTVQRLYYCNSNAWWWHNSYQTVVVGITLKKKR